jgi:uncharacterized membrane protein YoaK (UPF0700 family)
MPTKASDQTAQRRPRTSKITWASTVLVLLSLTTGATDAISYTRLGNVFASVMTGNMVLLGVSAGKREMNLAAHAGVSFAAYIAGAALGARLCGEQPSMRRWQQRARTALTIELVLFAGLTIGWELASAHPRGNVQLILLPMAVIAMAVQASLVRSMPQKAPSTTYMTGTLIAAIASLMMGSPLKQQERRIGAVVGLISGAGLATALVEEAPRAAPLLVIVLLLSALAVSTRYKSNTDPHTRRRRSQ